MRKLFGALLHELIKWNCEQVVFAGGFNCEPQGDPSLSSFIETYHCVDLGNMERWWQPPQIPTCFSIGDPFATGRGFLFAHRQ